MNSPGRPTIGYNAQIYATILNFPKLNIKKFKRGFK